MMSEQEYYVGGIQQVGIGVDSLKKAVGWYASILGFDVPLFRKKLAALFMTSYTAGEVQEGDTAVLFNLKGGGGLEIWQLTRKHIAYPYHQLMIGDTGIYSVKLKTPIIYQGYDSLFSKDIAIYNEAIEDPRGVPHFFLSDIYGNVFDVVQHNHWLTERQRKHRPKNGGVCGINIGVTDIDRSLFLYQDILGYKDIVFDEQDVFEDFRFLPGGKQRYRRVLLESKTVGPFSTLIGPSSIELIQPLDRTPQRIFRGRLWGDCGFIHVCFDVRGIDILKKRCEEAGILFTMDNRKSFTMGGTIGQFAYIEDPDGIMIELIEAYSIPVYKNWSIDLHAKKYTENIPSYLIKLLALKRLPIKRGKIIFS